MQAFDTSCFDIDVLPSKPDHAGLTDRELIVRERTFSTLSRGALKIGCKGPSEQ